MLARISVVLCCLICLCAPQADFAGRQSPAEEFLLNCGLLTAEKRLESRRVRVLIDLAEIFLENGQKAKAFEMLSQALEKTDIKENEVSFAASIARVYAKAGLLDRALDLVHKIAEPSPRAEALVWIASELVESGQTAKASELLSEAVALLKPEDDERITLLQIAITYAKIGECDLALKAAERISDKWIEFKARTLSETAAECAKAGRKDKTYEIIARALQTAGSIKGKGDARRVQISFKTEALANVAAAYIDLGESDKTISILNQAIETAGKLSSGLERVAAVYAKAGRYAQAMDTAKSIDYKPAQASTLVAIAHEHITAGNNESAVQVLTQTFELIKRFKIPDDSFKIDKLGEVAFEYVRAGDNRKASETLLYALQETWAEDKYSQTTRLVDIAKVYARTNLELDAEAKDVLQKICAGEPIPPTPDELAKKKRAEEAADRFIQRWHETLDLNVLFDEMYVTDVEQRRHNAYLFYGVYQFLTGAAGGPAVEKDVDEKLMREGFMAFWNLFYLMDEYDLAFSKSRDSDASMPPGFSEARKEVMKLKLNDKKISAGPIRQYIANANHMSSLLRKYLRPEVFEADLYKQNLKSHIVGEGIESEHFRITRGFPEYGVGENVEVYALKRGVFDFYFIEEKGVLKVLTLGFEL